MTLCIFFHIREILEFLLLKEKVTIKAKEKQFNGTISLRSLLFQTRLQIEVSLVTLSPSELLTSRTWLSALDKLHPITPGEFG